QNQPFAVFIEPANRVDTLTDMRHQVQHQRPFPGVVIRAEIAARLVHQPVNMPFAMDWAAVNGNVLTRLHACPQIAHNLTVDDHAASGDEIIAMPPGADAGMGEEFVEAVHGGHYNCRQPKVSLSVQGWQKRVKNDCDVEVALSS